MREEQEGQREADAARVHTDLTLHVHDDHRVGAVAHHKVLGVFGQQDDVVDRDVGAG